MLIIRLVMVHMGPKHTQYGQKTARLAPVLQNGLKGHVGALSAFSTSVSLCTRDSEPTTDPVPPKQGLLDWRLVKLDSPSKPGYHSHRSELTVQMVPKRCSWGCSISEKSRNITNWLTSRRRCYVQYARQTKESGAPPERDGPCKPLRRAQGPRVCTWST